MHKTHTMEMIFPELLFVVFSLCALFLMTTGFITYQTFNQTNETDITTALAYMKTKVDSGYQQHQMEITTIDNTPCLILKDTIEGNTYHTYIYIYNNQLSELWIPEKETPRFSDGTPIMDMQELTLSLHDQALTLQLKDIQNQQKQLVIYLPGGSSL